MAPASVGQQRMAAFVTRWLCSPPAQQYQRLVSSTFGGTATEFLTYEMDFNNQFLEASLKILTGHKLSTCLKFGHYYKTGRANQ